MKCIRIHMVIPLLAIFATITTCHACSHSSEGEAPSGPFSSTSPVILNSILQSNMVLQRNADVPFRGTGGTPGQSVKVTCSWTATEYIAQVGSDGCWEVKVPTPEAGGPFTITVEGRDKVVLDNVMSGDVWFCAGQSNMQMMVVEVENAEEELANANIDNIRLFNIDTRAQSDTPVDNIAANWTVCNQTTVRRFSAAGFFFGRELEKELDVPIGLINASWGNTPAEVWTNRELVMADEELKANALKIENNGSAQPNRAGNVYNAMVYPFRKFPIAGTVWYQGENNQSYAYSYCKLLKTLVGGWRSDWGYDFPFYIAQVCPRYRQYDHPVYYANPALRNQQRMAADEIPGSGLGVNDDIADLNDSHPKNKQDVGLRLACIALSKTYGKRTFDDKLSPMFDRNVPEGNKMRVWFDNVAGSLTTSDGLAPTCFEIAGEDGVFKAAEAVIDGNTVVLHNAGVPAPKYSRLGWSYYKVTNLRSSAGLPPSVYSTQTWRDMSEEPGSKGPAK